MTKSYKMIALRAWLDAATAISSGTANELPRITTAEIAARSARIITRDPRLLADLEGKDNPDPRTALSQTWERYWTKWPLEHLTGDVFNLTPAGFGLTHTITLPILASSSPGHGPDQGDAETATRVLARMLQELIDWRLAAYLTRNTHNGRIPIRVKNTGDRPILLNLPRKQHPEIPTGPTTVTADGRRYQLDFVKIAVNVAHPAEPSATTSSNVLPELLRGWFGPDAGQPGTEHYVELWREGDDWHLGPAGGSVLADEITG